MPDLASQLTAFAQGIQLSITPAATNSFTAQLTTPTGGAAPTLTEQVVQDAIQAGTLDLQVVMKNLRFHDADITNLANYGGMPIGDQLNFALQNSPLSQTSTALIGNLSGTVTRGSTNATGANVPGVPGLLARLSGTVPMVVSTTAPVSHPIVVSARWKILDNGNVDSAVSWSVGAESGTGGEFTPTAADTLQATTLMFPPAFVDLVLGAPTTVQRTIQISVQAQAPDLGLSSGWIDLPPVTIMFPTIPVPTILALFEHTSFSGRLLVIVPYGSPIGAISSGTGTTVTGALAALSTALGAVAGFSTTALTAGIAALTAAFPSNSADMKIVQGDVPQLEDIVWTDFIGIRIFSGEDSMNSLMMFGPPHRQAQCFNGRAYDTSEGQMNVTMDLSMVTSIASLNTATPASTPMNDVTVPVPPSGMRPVLHRIVSFAGEFSSVRFGWA